MEKFEDVVEQFTPMIYHVIHSLNIYKNIDEFFQTGMIALWEAKQRFDPDKGKFSTYAYSYIKGRIMTELSKHRKAEEVSVYPDEEFWEMAGDADVDVPFELATLLSYCVNLTERQRMWVVYSFYFGMTTREIAEHEGVTVSAVKKWRVGAMERIRGIWK
ncbi:sigma-70 family RNA polymerase sigma factor [Bacillus sp. FJAT-50079]|uniref:sigma-70 family RNA polymerase sigma factor n=1 Tax=Bacillus sp. FJAT-50079 TaxID=2833577 RepID=UPI001BCA015F|nr:sigma-70 family RNA polymerase sigma factor [Bacillus sp. FJAT-50079]MBS4206632.1 sigma-70 family RNA polymerase sigma factor [Bacillus sp. FJAT-50079]